MSVKDYKELEVYRLAFEAAGEIFEISKKFPPEERYSLTDQIRRATRSVCASIAEAWRKRRYQAAFVSKLSDADAEAAETEVWLDFALQCAYIQEAAHKKLMDKYDHICRQLCVMMKDAPSWCSSSSSSSSSPPPPHALRSTLNAPRSSSASRSTLPVPSKVEGPAPRASRAFTLLELLVVMVVMVVILTISLPAFINLGRGMSLRAAVNNVYATLALSRQWAITHREEVTFVGSATGLTYNAANGVIAPATNDHACFYVMNTAGNVIQAVTDLPLDITFDASAWANNETNMIFKTDGGLKLSGIIPNNMVYIEVVDKRNPSVGKTISINAITGGIKVE